MEFSERIYQLRKEKNMTQQELADQLGVSHQAVSRWEMCTARPEIESLTAMSKIFGLSLDELVTGEETVIHGIPSMPEKQEKKPGNRIWWIIWAVSFVMSLLIAVIGTVVSVSSNPYSFVTIHPMTLFAQVSSLALSLGIVVIIIRLLCRIGNK